MKTCSKCKIEKEIIIFGKDKRASDGYLSWCKDCNKEYKDNNKEMIKKYNKEYRENNKYKIKEYKKNYQENHKDKTNLRTNKRRSEDIQFKISGNLRTRLRRALKGNYKSGSAISDLGCSIDDLKLWLEDQFQDGMSWSNYGSKEGQWSIDHIIPLSKVDLTNREDLLKVCNYKNLQPLWHVENMKKGNK